MKKFITPYLSAAFIILGNALSGIGLLLMLDIYFGLAWSHILICAGVLFFQAALFWVEKTGFGTQFWVAVIVLNGAAGLVIYKTEADISSFLAFAGMEAACAAAALFCHLARGRMWLKAPLVALIFAGLVYFSINGIEMARWEVGEVLLCFLLFLAEIAEKKRISLALGKDTRKHSRERQDAGNHSIIYLFPVFLVAVIVLSALPVKSTPITWQFFLYMADSIQKSVTAAVNNVEAFFSGADSTYSISFTGYDQDGSLGGSITADEKVQLTVEGIGTNSPLYLTGSTFTGYTGQGWEFGENPYGEKEHLYSYENLMKVVSQGIYTSQEMQEFIRRRNYAVTYEGLRTESLFTVPASIGLVMPQRISYSAGEGGNLVFEKPKSTGFTYHINFLEIDFANEKMKALLRQEISTDAVLQNEESAQQEKEEEERRDFIYEQNTSLPEALPKRVRNLADSITEGAKTDYDRLKAIEAYLNTYEYTTTPETAPKGQDFTDYFLFESKSGYCTYFATAMAVLGRCEGIPTRYVEGFVTADTCNRKGIVKVTGQNAHAWVEAYIEPVGWVPFEPTPGYNNAANTAWEQAAVPQTSHKNVPLIEENSSEREEDLSTESSQAEDDLARGNFKSILMMSVKILMVLGTVSVLIVCFKAIQICLYRSSYEKKDEYGKILCTMKRILSFGARMGFSIEQGETLTAYCERIGTRIDTEEPFAEICIRFKSIRYGGKPAEPDDARAFEHYVKELERQYLQNSSMPKKIIYFLDKT